LIINPQPGWLPLLLFAVPGIVFAACAVNVVIFGSLAQSRSTIPALCLVIALLPTHLLALLLGSLGDGLAVAWGVVSLIGAVWGIRHRRELSDVIKLQPGDWRRLGCAGLATIPIIAPTIVCNFWDEQAIGGHHAIIAHLQNGAYPPRYLYEPSLPLRYHYAFDLAAAVVAGLLRIRPDQAIDFLTLILWPCMFLLLWRVGDYIGGPRAGLFVGCAVCFAGTWPLGCGKAANEPAVVAAIGQLIGACKIGGVAINPPFISYFFQHPWSLGVPIFLLVILQWAVFPERRFHGQAVLLLCSLALLSLAEIVLFLSLVAAMSLVEIWRLAHDRSPRAIAILLVLAASLAATGVMGGFFAPGGYPSAGGLLGTGIVFRDLPTTLSSALTQLHWNIASLGLLSVLGMLGLLCVRKERLFLSILAATGIVVVNLFRYQYTWDIVKFGTVSFIALAMTAGVVLAVLWDQARTRLRIFGFAAIIVPLTAQGLSFPVLAALVYQTDPKLAMIRPYFSRSFPIDGDEAATVSYLRTRMAPFDLMFRTRSKAEPYAVFGGLPYSLGYPLTDVSNDTYGLGGSKFFARHDLERISGDWVERLSAQNIRWVVSDSTETELNRVLDEAVGDGRVSTEARFGRIRISLLQRHTGQPRGERDGACFVVLGDASQHC
jgi:hypothetical protein